MSSLIHDRITPVTCAIVVFALVVGAVRSVDAQTPAPAPTAGTIQPAAADTPRWEFDIPSGAVVPTGDQRDAVKRGNLTAAQLSYVVHPGLAITATLGWATSRDLHAVGRPRLDVFTYDLGAEFRVPRWLAGRALTFSPFAAAGAGGRSYNHRHLDIDATHNVGAYVGVGGELGCRWIRLRLEVRDYVTGFRPLAGTGASSARNDVTVMAGLRLGRR